MQPKRKRQAMHCHAIQYRFSIQPTHFLHLHLVGVIDGLHDRARDARRANPLSILLHVHVVTASNGVQTGTTEAGCTNGLSVDSAKFALIVMDSLDDTADGATLKRRSDDLLALDAHDVEAVPGPVDGHVSEDHNESDRWDDVADASVDSIGNSTLDGREDGYAFSQSYSQRLWSQDCLPPPLTPMTRIPAPRRVFLPKFAVPRVNIVGYMGAMKKKI